MMMPARTAAFLLLLLPGLLAAETHYEIGLSRAASGWLDIEIDAACPRAGCDFQMPVWNATYQVRDFAQHVSRFEAHRSDGAPIPVSKLNPSLWRVAAEAGERVQVNYRVRADRPGPFGAVAEAQHVCLNLAQVLSYPVDTRGDPFTLRFANKPQNWKTAIELPERNGRYWAESYDRLVDTPVHLSDFEDTHFDHAGRRVRIVVHSPSGEHHPDALRTPAEKIVAGATEMMGEAPFSSYTFVYHFSDDVGGGMEYRNGTSIYAPSKCGRCDVSELTAHEFFHLWNVKRIRPRSLDPVDFTQPDLTPSLWFSEGVTSTYAQFLRLRSGLLGREEFFEHLTRLIYDYESRPASRTQSAEESSIDVWLERYPAYGRPERSVSYYVKGELIGYLLDLIIRHHTLNQRSLDDVMRMLNREYAAQGRSFEDTEAIEDAASTVSGNDLSTVFDELVRSAAPIDWDRYLGFAGLRLAVSSQERFDIGLHLTDVPGVGTVAASVAADGPAEEAGFRAGDHILTVDGQRAGIPRDVSRRLKEAAGAKVHIGISRSGALLTLTIRPRTTRDTFYRMIEIEEASAPQRAVRRGWLRTEPDSRPEGPATFAPRRDSEAEVSTIVQ